MKTLQLLTEYLQVTGNVKENIKLPLYQFTFKINTDLHETALSEELNLFRKIVSQETPIVDILKSVFQNNFLKVYLNTVTANKILLTPITVASEERSFSKLKLIKKHL